MKLFIFIVLKKWMMIKKLILTISIIIPTFLFGQHLFEEKFNGCITNQFALESDSVDAKMAPVDFINTIINGVDEKVLSKIEGVLKLQIIVDTDGRSCLLSVGNETNVTTSKLKLKKNIDSLLIWGAPSQKVSPIVFLKFKDGKVTYKRMGVNGNTGWHELVE